MKKQIVSSLIALAIAGTAFAQTQVQAASIYAPGGRASERPLTFFVEPSVIYVPGNNGSDDAFGGSLSGGVVLYKHHMIGMDLAYFEADYDKGPGKMKFMPLTASYQYVVPLGKNFEMRPGLFAGAMFEKSKGRSNVSDWPPISNSSRTAFTGGASLGFDYVFNKYVSVGVSGKWMYVDDVKDLRERNMAIIGINCNVRF